MNYIVTFQKQVNLEKEEYLVERKAVPTIVKTLLERNPDKLIITPTEMIYIDTGDSQ